MGHVFLRRLGKKRLRPGGKEATDFLLNHMQIRENQKILEITLQEMIQSLAAVA